MRTTYDKKKTPRMFDLIPSAIGEHSWFWYLGNMRHDEFEAYKNKKDVQTLKWMILFLFACEIKIAQTTNFSVI